MKEFLAEKFAFDIISAPFTSTEYNLIENFKWWFYVIVSKLGQCCECFHPNDSGLCGRTGIEQEGGRKRTHQKKIRSIEIEAAAVFSLYVGEDFANRNVEISMRIIWKRYRESKVRQKDFDWWLWKTAADSGRVCGVFSFLRVFFCSCVC